MNEKLVRIDQSVLKRATPKSGEFALQRVLKETGAEYEYSVGGEWIQGPPAQKPDARRVVFDLEQFRVARDVYFAWQDIITTKVDNPVFADVAIARLTRARTTQQPQVLFVPWGVRPKGRPRLETQVMDKMKEFETRLNERNIPTRVMVMPADVYATQINRNNLERSAEYFRFVAEQAAKRGFTVKPWSEIRNENQAAYNARTQMLTREEIQKILSYQTVSECLNAAKRRSGYEDPEEVQQAAFAYMRERICEAEIVDAIYMPIKVSAVAKFKDNDVDRDLPRVYILKPDEQFSWLK